MIKLVKKSFAFGNLSTRVLKLNAAPMFSSLFMAVPMRFKSDLISRFGDYYQINFGGESFFLSRSEMLKSILSLEGLDNNANIDDTLQDKNKFDRKRLENESPKDGFNTYNKDKHLKYVPKQGIKEVNSNKTKDGRDKYYTEYNSIDEVIDSTKSSPNLKNSSHLHNESLNYKTDTNFSKINPHNITYDKTTKNPTNPRINSSQTKKEPLNTSNDSINTKTDITNSIKSNKAFDNYDVLNSILRLLDESQYKGDKMKLLQEFVDFTNMKNNIDRKYSTFDKDNSNVPYKTSCDGDCDNCSYRDECLKLSSSTRKINKKQDKSDKTELSYLYGNDPILSDFPTSYIMYPPPYNYQFDKNDSNHSGGCCCHPNNPGCSSNDDESSCGSHQLRKSTNQNQEQSCCIDSDGQYHRYQNRSSPSNTSSRGSNGHQTCYNKTENDSDGDENHCCGRCSGDNEECCGRCGSDNEECCGCCGEHDQGNKFDDGYLNNKYPTNCCDSHLNYNRDNYYGNCSNMRSTQVNKHECCCGNHPGNCIHEQQCEDGDCKCNKNLNGSDGKQQNKQIKEDKNKGANQQSNESNDIWTDPPVAFK